MSRLILSGLSAIGFFGLSRRVMEEDSGHVIRVVPYFPEPGTTWIEYVARHMGGEFDEIYVLGSLNYMLTPYNANILARRYRSVVLVPDKGFLVWAHTISSKYRGFKVRIIEPPRLNVPVPMLRDARRVLAYLYTEKPRVLEEIAESVAIPELDPGSLLQDMVQRYHGEASNALYSLMHQLIYREDRGGVSIWSADSVDDKYMPMLPLLARLKALSMGKPTITVYNTVYTVPRNPYAYIILSLPLSGETRSRGIIITASKIKKLMLSIDGLGVKKAAKAIVAGRNVMELMVYRHSLAYIMNRITGIINKSLINIIT